MAVYVDDMNSIALFADDSRTGTGRYIGRTGTFIGVGTPGAAAGWIDNVHVEADPVNIPEPLSLLLAFPAALHLMRRRP